jgi:hypothetical protein
MRVDVLFSHGRVSVTHLSLHGDVDALDNKELMAESQKADCAGARDMLLDLREVTFLSSSGLLALQSITALRRSEQSPDPESGRASFRSIRHGRDGGSRHISRS